MKEEILAAVMFLVRFIEKSETFPRDQLENFKNILTTLLTQRFEKHWFPEVPAKGQGYRCIRVNGLNPVDLTLERAAAQCGLSYRDLRLPTELTVWVDPSEVCYRLGESEGSYCTLASFPTDSMACLSLSPSSYDRQHRKARAAMGATGARAAASDCTTGARHQYRPGVGSATYTGGMSALRMRQIAGMAALGTGTARSSSGAQWQRCERSHHLPMPLHHAPYHYPGAARYMPHHRNNYKNVVTV